MKKPLKPKSIKLKSKTKRTLSTVAFLAAAIAAIILLNLVVGAAADKIQLRWDLTENKLYALTDETKNVLDGLTEEVTLYYFVSAGQEIDQVERSLDMYRTASDKLKIMRIDPNANPIEARRFTDKGISVQQNTIVVEQGTRCRAVSPSEIYQSFTSQSGQSWNNALFGLEQSVTRAIAYVSASDTQKVYFTIGHNETDYTHIANILYAENMSVQQVDLKTTDVPADADSLYIMAPAADFAAEEILRLDAFLSTGKGVHIAFDAYKKTELPRLDAYLQDFWGVTMYHDLVLETDSYRYLDYMHTFSPDVAGHKVTEAVTAGNQSIIVKYARSMELVPMEDVSATMLASTTAAGISRHGSDPDVAENIREGALPVMAALERVSKEGLPKGRMVVSGSYQMYDPLFLEEASIANRTLLYGVANFVHYDEDAPLSIAPKSLLIRFLMLEEGLTTFYIIVVCVLPALLFFAAGIRTWRRRRNL